MRALTFLLFIATVASGLDAQAELYEWSLSGSSVDPYVNTAAATAPGEPFEVYLWLSCTPTPPTWDDGVIAAAFSLDTDFANLGFEVQWPPALNAGDSVDLGLAIICSNAPTLMGTWTLEDPSGSGGYACLVAGPNDGVVRCADGGTTPPDPYPISVRGFATGGELPCAVGECEGTVSSEGSRWGAIKSWYR